VDGVRCLAPTDGDAGGTWISTNAHGLTLGLLNGYEPRDRAHSGARSRGLLVRELGSAATLDDVEARVAALDLARYRSFRLLTVDAASHARGFTWSGDGAVAVERAVRAPLVSSSFDPDGAAAARAALFRELGLGEPGVASAALAAFHAGHRPARGPLSVCMHRDDAATVSLTRVLVGADEVRLEYVGGPPCERRPAVSCVLRRVDRATSRT
jgi:hypothetical protein